VIRVRPLDRLPAIREEPGPGDPLPERLRSRVEAAWQAAQVESGHRLWDGLLFHLGGMEASAWWGRFVPYRLWVAGRRDPELRRLLGLRPLAVCGLLWQGDALVLGRRTGRAVQDPGCWELAPSGGVDPAARGPDGGIDLAAALLRELQEEVNLSEAGVEEPRSRWVAEDETEGTVEVAFELRARASAAELRARFEARPRPEGGPEYETLCLVSAAELPAFVAGRAGAFSPVSLALLRVQGLLPPA